MVSRDHGKRPELTFPTNLRVIRANAEVGVLTKCPRVQSIPLGTVSVRNLRGSRCLMHVRARTTSGNQNQMDRPASDQQPSRPKGRV